MSDFKAVQKTFPVQFSAIASGDGYWNMPKGFRVDFTEVVANVSLCDGEVWAELQFVHEHIADEDSGLAYTDKGVEAAVQTFVARHPELSKLFYNVSGSEQGMQGADFLSCDASVENLMTLKKLEALGYKQN